MMPSPDDCFASLVAREIVTAKFIKVGHLVGEAPLVRRSLCGKYFLMPET